MKDQSNSLRLNQAKWDKWADTYDSSGRVTGYLRKTQEILISQLDLDKNTRFLDIGCGTGWALGRIAAIQNNKGFYYGADLSPKMIEKAQENFSDREHFRFIQANVESIPLNSGSFDIIICTSSFHHYPNPLKALREMKRLLRPDGKLYIVDPTADSLLIKLADKLIRLLEPEHVKLYSTKEFGRLFTASGLNYMESKTVQNQQKVHIAEKTTEKSL